MKIRHFQLLRFILNALALPAAAIFLLCSYSIGCREAIHDEFLLAEVCHYVSDVLKFLTGDKCNE